MAAWRVTYARIAKAPVRWGRKAAGGTAAGGSSASRTLVIADEAHHLGEELTCCSSAS
jgi:hypothetical protein